jgi:hypothetical protein
MFKTPLLSFEVYASSKILSIKFTAGESQVRAWLRVEFPSLSHAARDTMQNTSLGRSRTILRIADANGNLTPSTRQLVADIGIFDGNPEDQGHENNDQGIFHKTLTILLN